MNTARIIKQLLPSLTIGVLAGCSDSPPMLNLGIDDSYYIYRMQKLPLTPALTGASYRWSMASGEVLSTERDYIFLAEKEGAYNLVLDIIDEETPFHFEFSVTVVHEEIDYSPYISKVYEYRPAPGQFVNTMPQYETGDSYDDMLRKVEESLSGTNDIMVSLGGFGGYVVFGFDHTVINHPGEKDFMILGNSFYELSGSDRKGGSAEPGIVMVSYDRNCNGIPDDEWYEIAGSEHNSPATIRNYSITYHRPNPDREIISQGPLVDINYIMWEDSEGTCSSMPKNNFHRQEYYPAWVEDDALTFSGTRLADNGVDVSGTGAYYVLYCYDWGYADNHPNDYADLNSFDISWAVDKDGMPVVLPGVDFVKVYTGINQYCGWIGETSTEICRAQDLHIPVAGQVVSVPLK
ncbi:MAG: cell surface protein [Muribaculaceae bacterium]|nr:cell surface protein [Muribaculaceae bacterium]